MKKFFMFLFVLLCAVLLTGCFEDVETLEWETLPESIYIQGTATLDSIDDGVKIKINGTSYTLASARLMSDVTVSGFETSTLGKGLITIKYKSLTIYYQYEVVQEIPTDEPVVPSTAWYDGNTSPFTLNTIEDLYGLAKLVNVDHVTFAGKVVKLGVDIDLSEKVWTPIGESARKKTIEVTFDQLPKNGGKFPSVGETEAQYNVRLDTQTKTLEKYVFIGNYYFAEELTDGSYKYKLSDVALDTNQFFAGTFDGQGHTITGLSDVGYTPKTSIIYASSSRVLQGYTFGLFGAVEGNVTVKNLTFENVTINGAYYNSGNDELVTAELDSVGAAIGYVSKVAGSVTIDNVKVLSGSISAFASAGGIVGRIYILGNVLIQNCENRANIIIDEFHAGGIAGYLSNQRAEDLAQFINNTNYGNVNSQKPDYAGAMVEYAVKATFTNCRNFGNISGTRHTGLGMVGVADAKYTFTDCVNYGTLSN